MDVFTIILFSIAIITVIIFLIQTFINRGNRTDEEEHHHDGENGVCCGRHTVCSHGYEKKDLYFDDEELDRFKDKPYNEYTDNDIEEFRNILYTMKREEVDLWVKCLEQRHIEIPEQIKDEILLILQ